MKRIAHHILYFFIATVFIGSESSAGESKHFTIDEGRGIRSLVSIGDNIDEVYKVWGKPERAEKDDFPYATDMFYEYHKRGVLFSSDEKGILSSITFYCNTGNKEQFHKTGLIWINPSTIYSTFSGITSKGLTLRDRMLPGDVYKIYGKPKKTIELGQVEDIRVINKAGKPYIYKMGKAGYRIVYPNLGISFNTYAEFVESVDVSRAYE